MLKIMYYLKTKVDGESNNENNKAQQSLKQIQYINRNII